MQWSVLKTYRAKGQILDTKPGFFYPFSSTYFAHFAIIKAQVAAQHLCRLYSITNFVLKLIKIFCELRLVRFDPKISGIRYYVMIPLF